MAQVKADKATQTTQSNAGADVSSSNALRTQLRGLSYAEGAAALSPDKASDAVQLKPTEDDATNETSGEKDIPGILYANTSDSNLVRQTKEGEKPVPDQSYDWEGMIGFTTGVMYEADLTFDDLVKAGRDRHFPTATAVKSGLGRTHDYFGSPGGVVVEGGTVGYAMRGGLGVGKPVHLRFSNNGALNLSRLARAAYNLACGRGSKIVGGKVEHYGNTYSLQCTHTFGNKIEEAGARDHGFIGEFAPKYMQEKVNETVKLLCGAVSVAFGKTTDDVGAYQQNDKMGYISPDNPVASVFQINKHRQGASKKAKSKNNPRAEWLTIDSEIAASAGARITNLWAPQDMSVRTTYIPSIRDFGPDVLTTLDNCRAVSSYERDKFPAVIMEQVRVIQAAVNVAPMELHLIKDKDQNARTKAANRAIIETCFATVNEGVVDSFIKDLKVAKYNSVTKPNEGPVKGSTQQGEGLIKG